MIHKIVNPPSVYQVPRSNTPCAIKQFTVDKGRTGQQFAYFAVLSLAPLLLAVFSIMTLFLASAADQVENFAQTLSSDCAI